jgi:broad specificity phosphatase PhoE
VSTTSLWLVRHGESVANVAASEAERSGSEAIEVAYRDADVPLSERGVEQAEALGAWLEQNHPAAVYCSPYLRARQTLETGLTAAGSEAAFTIDERLRDRELGILDLLTSRGVDARFPTEAARRRWLGKFYYRPPGGESWADVAGRIRSFLGDVVDRTEGPVLIGAHDAVITLFAYVCCGMTEQEVLDFSLTHPVANATVTRIDRAEDGTWTLASFAEADHLEQEGAPQTLHPGDKDADVH